MISLRCLLGFHKPDRSAVVREPLYFATHCVGCGKDLRRISKGRWVEKKRSHRVRHSKAPATDLPQTGTENTSATQAGGSDAGRA